MIEIAVAVLAGAAATLLLGGVVLWLMRRRPTGSLFGMGMLWRRIEALSWGVRAFVEVDQVDPRRTLSTQAVLQRGWSPELIEQVLGRPDYAVLDPQRKREPLRLYDRDRVEKAEQGHKFQTWRAQVAEEQAVSEARIRKWLELRHTEPDSAEPAQRGE